MHISSRFGILSSTPGPYDKTWSKLRLRMKPGTLIRLTALIFFLLTLSGSAGPTNATDKSDWWSFQPPKKPPLPTLTRPQWARNPIDLFILAKLQQQGLQPSPEADRRTLIRRLSFDLTGLPPIPQEVAQFIADNNPNAYERLVDRLLASPRYGERWARHWLDTVHYGETHGYDKDKPRTNAWPYRDYVIRAFNQDKPYARFIEEQLAGDVLFPDDPDGIVAMGFIAAGPWDYVGHVELPIEKTDGLIARYNDRDDMVMNTISTFQSLTVHCARCHNHKFDPITQKDYYGLQAVFAGVDRHDRPFDTDKQVHVQRRWLDQERKLTEQRFQILTNQIAKISSSEIQELDADRENLKQQLQSIVTLLNQNKSPGNGYHSAIEKVPDLTKWVQIDLAKSLPIEEVRLIPARPVDFPDTPGFGFPPRFRVEVSDEPEFSLAQLICDHTRADFSKVRDQPVSFSAEGKHGRFLRVTATRQCERSSDYVFALAEVEVMVAGTNAALGAEVSALDSIEEGLWSRRFLVDGFDSRHKLNDPNLQSKAILESKIKAIEEKRIGLVERLIDESTRSELVSITNHLHQIDEQIAALPPHRVVYAAVNDFKTEGSFVPPKTPRPVYLLAKGDVKRPGELMHPAGISSVPGPEPDFALPGNESARRAALAKWLTDPRNMLTRLSIANRVWLYHFGQGIVETPNDFGHMGALPTHPELLDWLAFWFLENGESLKKLHRLILTSATYRQSSGGNPESTKLDAENHFLWRMNRTRLDAETIHDSMLFIAGNLDLTMGGPSVQQFYFKDDHSPVYDYSIFDVDSPAARRRSIYRFVVRSVPDPLMDSLDCPNPSILTPKRNVTTTSLQALAILNDPFVLKQCQHFAERLAPESSLERQIRYAYELALNRRPTASEAKLLKAFAQQHGTENVCRLLFNTSEFMFAN